MTLRERRCLFTALVARLLVAISERAWSHGRVEIAMDEGTIHTPRKVRQPDGSSAWLEDAVHKRGSRHHEGLAVDLLVYIDGGYVGDGSHPIWGEIEAMARALDPRFGLGIRFRDANHLSFDE